MIIRFKNFKSTKTQKSRRTRECCICNKNIYKDEIYNFNAFRYDKTIISLYTHLNCKK